MTLGWQGVIIRQVHPRHEVIQQRGVTGSDLDSASFEESEARALIRRSATSPLLMRTSGVDDTGG